MIWPASRLEVAQMVAGPSAGLDPATRSAETAVSDHAIRTWCAALDDDNPVCRGQTAARDAGYGGVIAPPAMLHESFPEDDGDRFKIRLRCRARRTPVERLGAVTGADGGRPGGSGVKYIVRPVICVTLSKPTHRAT